MQNWKAIYPIYLDKSVSTRKGRKTLLENSVDKPMLKEICTVLESLKIKFHPEPEKRHPKDFFNYGRVKYCLEENGVLFNPEIKNQKELLSKIAQLILQLKSRKKKQLILQMTNFGSGNFKQKNKKFKGSRKQKFKGIVGVKRKIKKDIRVKGNIKKRIVEDFIGKSQILTEEEKKVFRQKNNFKIVLIVSLNEGNLQGIDEFLQKVEIPKVQGLDCHEIHNTFTWNGKYPQLKSNQRYLFVNSPRDQSVLQYLKVADLVIAVSSLSYVVQNDINNNPADQLHLIDDFGNYFINLMRAQGILTTINFLSDKNKINKKKLKDVLFYSKRLLQQEFPQAKIIVDDYLKLAIEIQRSVIKQLKWRKRGYMLVQQIQRDSEGVYLTGVVRNQFSQNELLHITGLGDFKYEKACVYSKKQEFLIKSPKNVQNEIINEDIELEEQEEEDVEKLSDLQQELEGLNFEENRKLILNKREEDDKMVDEVEFESDEIIKKRLVKYKYMKSFLKNDWNQYDNLPDFYKKILLFKNIKSSFKNSLKRHYDNSFVFDNFTVTFYIKGITQLPNIVILSSLLNHEIKINMNHLKMKFHNENQEEVISKQNYTIHQGFRVQTQNVVFSHIYTQNKFKYTKKLPPLYHKWFLCSFYGQIYFPPQNILLLDNKGKLLMIGNSLLPDPFKVILKRIILTGIPHRIKKKQATIKHMFFNTEDILYYQKNEVYSKQGLKGKIKESLGTKGHMKVLLNGYLKPNDLVCMNLYKRVYPKFNN